MNQATVFDLTAGNILAGEKKTLRFAADAIIVTAASLILFASSKMSVEVGPVPVTMQSIAVILMALVLGPQRATAAALLYFVECWAIPGFSARPMPLTGGYVLGFALAAAIAGQLYTLGHGRSLLKALAASTVANIAIFAVGLPWLALSVGYAKAWEFGGQPFLVAELIKIAIGVVLLKSTTSLANRLSQ